MDGDDLFDTVPPDGSGPGRSYTRADTRGCSCEQIIEAATSARGTRGSAAASARDARRDLAAGRKGVRVSKEPMPSGEISLPGHASPVVVVRGVDLPWQASPSPFVWRKRLYHSGPIEAGIVTSIVRYDPGARFHAHDHPDGEEILVLEGTFSDERGDFPAGTYMLNPEGFRHAPFSREGCLLFVKLRQYAGADRERVLLQTEAGEWVAREQGARSMALYSSARYPEQVRLTELAPGAELPLISLPEGEEVLVLRGELVDERGTYPAYTWLALPRGSSHRPRSPEGCLLYVRSPLAAFPGGDA